MKVFVCLKWNSLGDLILFSSHYDSVYIKVEYLSLYVLAIGMKRFVAVAVVQFS